MKYFEYSLYSRGSLNAVSTRREFRGALILTEGGVGCLHPWPEFGDEPIEGQLELLRVGKSSKVIERALCMAQVDGEARKRGVSLFQGLEIPRCHYSWDQNQSFESQVQRVVAEGWHAVKTKGSGDIKRSLKWLGDFSEAAPYVKVRMDFNSCLTEDEFSAFLAMVSEQILAQVDFFEDPFPYSPEKWIRVREGWPVRLALDKQLRGAVHGYDVAVLKPGRRDWRVMVAEMPAQMPVVMTSAMDHAIGQSFAAWEAAEARHELGPRLDLCGLCTEHLFAADPFFDCLESRGGVLCVDRKGTGLGFDEVLEAVPWREL